MQTRTGYRGDEIVLWDELEKLNDEETKIDVATFDHDKSSQQSEELHVAVGVSSCCGAGRSASPSTSRRRTTGSPRASTAAYAAWRSRRATGPTS